MLESFCGDRLGVWARMIQELGVGANALWYLGLCLLVLSELSLARNSADGGWRLA